MTSFLCLFGIVGARSRERTSSRHSDIWVGILGLGTGGFVHTVLWFVHLELGVHVPTKFLSRCLWVVELRLWLAFEWFKFIVQYFEFLFSIDWVRRRSCALSWVDLGWLLRDCNHYNIEFIKFQISVTTKFCVQTFSLTILRIEIKVLIEDSSSVFFSYSFYPAWIDLEEVFGKLVAKK